VVGLRRWFGICDRVDHTPRMRTIRIKPTQLARCVDIEPWECVCLSRIREVLWCPECKTTRTTQLTRALYLVLNLLNIISILKS